jgi:hypothetical protein
MHILLKELNWNVRSSVSRCGGGNEAKHLLSEAIVVAAFFGGLGPALADHCGNPCTRAEVDFSIRVCLRSTWGGHDVVQGAE